MREWRCLNEQKHHNSLLFALYNAGSISGAAGKYIFAMFTLCVSVGCSIVTARVRRRARDAKNLLKIRED